MHEEISNLFTKREQIRIACNDLNTSDQEEELIIRNFKDLRVKIQEEMIDVTYN